ncbi:hypothetical protein [Streptomyces sp. NPDC007088]|uniref:hypothetical protein n=1 Tax=Streptomyces sp. NPDC007088 TaxID=3364773 RepID=UPI003694CA18
MSVLALSVVLLLLLGTGAVMVTVLVVVHRRPALGRPLGLAIAAGTLLVAVGALVASGGAAPATPVQVSVTAPPAP